MMTDPGKVLVLQPADPNQVKNNGGLEGPYSFTQVMVGLVDGPLPPPQTSRSWPATTSHLTSRGPFDGLLVDTWKVLVNF